MDLMYAGNAWKSVVYKIAGEDKKDFVTLAFGWKKIVGKLLAERTNLHKLENQVLFVSVYNSVWLQELILRKTQIKKDIESVLKLNLKEIVFFVGKENHQTRYF